MAKKTRYYISWDEGKSQTFGGMGKGNMKHHERSFVNRYSRDSLKRNITGKLHIKNIRTWEN